MNASFEKLCLTWEAPPWNAVYRIMLGFAILAAWTHTHVRNGWMILPFFLTMLFLLRFVSYGLRKLLPFSDDTKAVWLRLRKLGKRYDSFEWRKLLWIGVGLSAYAIIFRESQLPAVVLAVLCLIAGVFGWAVFRRVSHSQTEGFKPPQPIT